MAREGGVPWGMKVGSREGGVPWGVRVGSRGVFTFEARSARATPAGEADTAVLVDGSAARAPLVLLERVIAAPQRIAGVLVGSAASSSSSAQSAHDLVLSMPRRARIICCQLRAGDARGEAISAWYGVVA